MEHGLLDFCWHQDLYLVFIVVAYYSHHVIHGSLEDSTSFHALQHYTIGEQMHVQPGNTCKYGTLIISEFRIFRYWDFWKKAYLAWQNSAQPDWPSEQHCRHSSGLQWTSRWLGRSKWYPKHSRSIQLPCRTSWIRGIAISLHLPGLGDLNHRFKSVIFLKNFFFLLIRDLFKKSNVLMKKSAFFNKK